MNEKDEAVHTNFTSLWDLELIATYTKKCLISRHWC